MRIRLQVVTRIKSFDADKRDDQSASRWKFFINTAENCLLKETFASERKLIHITKPFIFHSKNKLNNTSFFPNNKNARWSESAGVEMSACEEADRRR